VLATCLGLAFAHAGAQQQANPGANVNVISGTGADGDWTLQRQNEPSIACSSRNPQNCLAGANDYRTVDIPFPNAGEKITGDAWLGWYTSKNGGLTWRTRLLPGYPQDASAVGLASPLRGYAAGADPVIRPGTNGLFYYGGLVFNREEGGGSAIFVARFIDNNNQEGSAGEPIEYLGASIVHRLGAAPVVARRRGLRRLNGRRRRPRARRGCGPASSSRALQRSWWTNPGSPSTSRGPAPQPVRSADPVRACRFRRFRAGASTSPMRCSTVRTNSAGASCSVPRPTAARRGAPRACSAASRAGT
jgi:hypothetical protein